MVLKLFMLFTAFDKDTDSILNALTYDWKWTAIVVIFISCICSKSLLSEFIPSEMFRIVIDGARIIASSVGLKSGKIDTWLVWPTQLGGKKTLFNPISMSKLCIFDLIFGVSHWISNASVKVEITWLNRLRDALSISALVS